MVKEFKMAMGEPTCMHKEHKQKIQGGGVGWDNPADGVSEWASEWGENIAKYFVKASSLFAKGLFFGLGFSTAVFAVYCVVTKYIAW
jgi:hypothetical protein